MAVLGYQTLFMLDTNPNGTANYVRLGAGITNVAAANNETVSQKSYQDGDGAQSSEVTGFQRTLAFTFDHVLNDPALDYILNRSCSVGETRKANFQQIESDGRIYSGGITIASIAPPGGDPGAEQSGTFEIHYNGKPTNTAPVAATAVGATIAAGSTSGTTTATKSPDSGDSLYYRLTSSALSANNRQYIETGILTAYTSGAEIAAEAGQYLNLYELDAYKHVVYFESVLLDSGDIAV